MSSALAQPRMRVFAGPNGSGKSTILGELQPGWIGAYVNADDIERQLRLTGSLNLDRLGLRREDPHRAPRYKRHLAESELLRRHGLTSISALTHLDGQILHLPLQDVNSYVAAVLADSIRRDLMAQGSTFTFETVMSSPDKVAFMREAKSCGYRTYLYFVATADPEINISRVRLRVRQGGHDVPETLVRSRYDRSIALLDAACNAADRAYVFDNSGSEHRLLVEVTNGVELTVRASTLPGWFTQTTLWQSFHPS